MRAMLKIFRINIWLDICNNFQYFLKAIKPSPMETERGGIVQVAATICSLMVGQNIRAYAYIYNKSPALSIKRLDKKNNRFNSEQ